MRTAYIAYNKRSCVTGKGLFDELKKLGLEGATLRRTMNQPKRNPDILIRWGNSLLETPDNCIEINTKQALENTADKGEMIDILSNAEGVRIPDIATSLEDAVQIADGNGMVYIRNQHDHVRYDHATNYRNTDKYALRPVDKVREYRVHIFNGSTIGMYEKIPNDGNVRIYKNDNCTFRRVDQASPNERESILGIRPMCRSAVAALGLVFGGVDVLVDGGGNIFINEVNSAPALNGPNLERWASAIQGYVNSVSLDGGDPAPNNEEQQREQLERRREQERLARLRQEEAEKARRLDEVTTRLHTVAQEAGFTITSLNLSES